MNPQTSPLAPADRHRGRIARLRLRAADRRIDVDLSLADGYRWASELLITAAYHLHRAARRYTPRLHGPAEHLVTVAFALAHRGEAIQERYR